MINDSVGDPWHFDTGSGSADPYLRLTVQKIRIRLFSSVTFKIATKIIFSFLLFEATFTSFLKDGQS